jgi:hypothetical protein
MQKRGQFVELCALALVGFVEMVAVLSSAVAQDLTQGTVGWHELASGTVGITQGQTLRLSVVNVSGVGTVVFCGLWQNPEPIAVLQDSFPLPPGHGKDCDLKASQIAKQHFDKSGQV